MLQGLPVKDHGAAVPGKHAGKYVHQRGFARAVFAQQCVYLSAAHGKIHVIQHGDAEERLGD